MTIEILLKALKASWSLDTAYSKDRDKWSKNNIEAGQCAVTAMIVYDYFGGEICRGFSEEKNIYHFWNIIEQEIIDLTKNQFKENIVFDKVDIMTKSELINIPSVNCRYIKLKKRVVKHLKRIEAYNDKPLTYRIGISAEKVMKMNPQ